jgi:hypothetical protein
MQYYRKNTTSNCQKNMFWGYDMNRDRMIPLENIRQAVAEHKKIIDLCLVMDVLVESESIEAITAGWEMMRDLLIQHATEQNEYLDRE